MRRFINKLTPELKDELIDAGLTRTQLQVLESLCNHGLDETASRMCLDKASIKYHLTKIFKAVGVKNRPELLIRIIPLCEHHANSQNPRLPKGLDLSQ